MEDYSRRHILRGSLWMFAALCAGLPKIVASAKEPKHRAGGILNWEEFVARLERQAALQHKADWSQAAYVASIAGLLGTLDSSDPFLHRATGARRGLLPTPDFSDLLRTIDVQISLVTFETGESLPHHDHPSMTGVLTCASGDLLVESYDRLASNHDGSSSPLLLRNVGSQIIAPGQVSTLTSTRRNIHFVKALSFTQVIDIFSPPYDAQRTEKTNWYRLERPATRRESDIFIAHPY